MDTTKRANQRSFLPVAFAAVPLALWATTAAMAAPAPTIIAPSLAGPEVVKLDWNTRGVVAADIDGDGRTDLAVINNERARIELLYQRAPGSEARTKNRRVVTNRWEPELEDSRFEKQPVTIGIGAFDLAIGDLNGDGRADLAYTGDPDALTIRFQSKDATWDEKRTFDLGKPIQFLTGLRLADLDGDKRTDLLVILQKDLVVLRQGKNGEMGAPERYAVPEDSSYSLELVDIDGDGRRDLVYLASNRRDALRLRLQQADGTFGPEIPFRIETTRSTLQLVNRGEGRSPALAYVQNQTSLLCVIALEPETSKAPRPLTALKPRVYSTRVNAKTPPSYAFGDVDGDKRTDLIVADGEGAQIFVHFQNAGGELSEARNFPSLPDGRSVAAADWDGDGRAEIFVASPKEQTLGVATFTKEGRLGYPQPIPVTGKPLAIEASAAPGGTAAGPLLAVAIEESSKRRIDFIARVEGAARVVATTELSAVRTDPRAIRFVDANQDGLVDLAVFVPFESMRLLVQQSDATFTDVSTAPTFRKGLVDNLDPSSLTLADVDGDGRTEMLISGNGFARALRLDASGTLQVVDQFNAREAGTDIGATFIIDVDGDGSREAVLYDRKGEQLQILRRNAQGVFNYVDTVPAGRLDLVLATQFDLNHDGTDDLFFLGKDRFWLVPVGGRDFRVETLLTYETDLKDVRHDDVTVGDLNNDGVSDYVLADMRRNLLEVITRPTARDVAGSSALHFRVFESDPHAQRKGNQASEPRETCIADVTGDGRKDLILLVHDRLLIYPQE